MKESTTKNEQERDDMTVNNRNKMAQTIKRTLKHTGIVCGLLLSLAVTQPLTAHAESYTVKAGDNLWRISLNYGVSVESIKEANDLSGELLSVGTVLIIPTAGETEEETVEFEVEVVGVKEDGIEVVEFVKPAIQMDATHDEVVPEPEPEPEPEPVKPVEKEKEGINQPGMDTYELLLAVVQQEGGHSFESAAWVTNTIMNRVNSPQFPSTIEGVIKQQGQFQAYWAGHYKKQIGNISPSVRQGVDSVLNGEHYHDYLFFWGASYAQSKGRKGENVAGNVYFNSY